MRKINGRYYFIYSSMQNHELCYAVSDLPDRGFSFGGTIVSNGDIGFDGRSESDKHNMTGTTHGSIERINGEYYVFYHRLTHKSDYSRQACAEKIFVNDDGSIDQVELTSCGLNGKPLKAEPGCAYPAVIACIITNGHMPHGCNSIYTESFPNVNNTGDERFISEISDGTLIGYKYFDFKNVRGIRLTLRAESERNRVVYNGPVRADIRATITEAAEVKSADETARFELYLEENGKCIAAMEADENDCWHALQLSAEIPNGVHAVFLRYCGNIHFQLKEIEFI